MKENANNCEEYKINRQKKIVIIGTTQKFMQKKQFTYCKQLFQKVVYTHKE